MTAVRRSYLLLRTRKKFLQPTAPRLLFSEPYLCAVINLWNSWRPPSPAHALDICFRRNFNNTSKTYPMSGNLTPQKCAPKYAPPTPSIPHFPHMLNI